MELDRTDPEGAIAAAAKRCSNWGRWGPDDVHGTLNFLDDAKRRESTRLDEIESSVNRLRIPLSFYHEVHLLRSHIEMVRRHLQAPAT